MKIEVIETEIEIEIGTVIGIEVDVEIVIEEKADVIAPGDTGVTGHPHHATQRNHLLEKHPRASVGAVLVILQTTKPPKIKIKKRNQ